MRVLFLCTGNSARSILAEATLRHLDRGANRFEALSAGSHPKGEVHPLALSVLERAGIATAGLRSKPWDEFAGTTALDFVFTVCDQAAGESCPFWPGQPITAHWGLPDPASVQGDELARFQAFFETWVALKRRIEIFLSLPFDRLERASIHQQLEQIGKLEASS
jgi:arsenate reductase